MEPELTGGNGPSADGYHCPPFDRVAASPQVRTEPTQGEVEPPEIAP